jgi:hypothetical protein
MESNWLWGLLGKISRDFQGRDGYGPLSSRYLYKKNSTIQNITIFIQSELN